MTATAVPTISRQAIPGADQNAAAARAMRSPEKHEMNGLPASSSRRQWVSLATLLCALALGGCDRAGNSSTPSNANASPASGTKASSAASSNDRQVVCDVQQVPVQQLLFDGARSGPLEWRILPAPDGSHCAITRKIGYSEYRIDIDAQIGTKTFKEVPRLNWSDDSATLLCYGPAKDGPPGELVIVNGTALGPYKRVIGAFPGSGGKPWFAVVQNGPTQASLLDPHGLTPLSGVPTQVATLPSGDPVMMIDNVAKGRDGKIIPMTEEVRKAFAPAELKPALTPPSAKIDVSLVPSGMKTDRHKPAPQFQRLDVNGSTVGTFASVVKRPAADRSQFGFQQPDGRILFYVVDQDQLVRIYVKP